MTAPQKKGVADPCPEYDALSSVWKRVRAVCNGERHVKEADSRIDTVGFSNYLIPFSPSMTPSQYSFFKAEAELPGIVSQFSRMLVGGLLRKQPILTLSDAVPKGAYDWIMDSFGQDDTSLAAFLDSALWEEMQTSRAWVFVDYPQVPEDVSPDEVSVYKPYPILYRGEDVINWQTELGTDGTRKLSRVIVRGTIQRKSDENEFHPKTVQVCWVHELNEVGHYQIRVFEKSATADGVSEYKLTETISSILMKGEPLTEIPAWPLNGSLEPIEPMLTPIVDKELALYNKISRRNHLLYGAATYTPVVFSEMDEQEFGKVVGAGLGSWLKFRHEDRVEILRTPSEALQDMDRAISAAIEEMAKLGIRMLSPESAQSGVALQLRNAAQTAQLGTLNNKVSNTMTQVINFMLRWYYGEEYTISDVEFSLSADFNPIPMGSDWLRLATEWYRGGLIPRSAWLQLLKQNDMLMPDYNDKEAMGEINKDELIQAPRDEDVESMKAILAESDV